MVVLRTPGRVARRASENRRRIHRRGRRDGSVRADLWRLASAAAGARSIRSRRWPRPRRSGETGPASARPAGQWSDAVTRSLITLKALTHRPTGGIVAGADDVAAGAARAARATGTTAICWLRDATFTLLALMNAGYYEDARAWREWLLARGGRRSGPACRSCTASPASIACPNGRCRGCRATKARARCASAMPRASSCSSTSTARSWMPFITAGTASSPPNDDGLGLAAALLEHLETDLAASRTTASGRCAATARQFTIPRSWPGSPSTAPSSRVEQFEHGWPGRALADAARQDPRRGLPIRLQSRARRLRAELRLATSRRQRAADAAGRLSAAARSARALAPSTPSSAISCATAWCMRYDSEAGIDGLPPGEGAFLPCSFWLADNLILLGRRRRGAGAVRSGSCRCATTLACCPRNTIRPPKRLVGNFPQAFSHVALVNTAYLLSDQSRHHRQEADAIGSAAR